ncbi:MAG TPA: protein-L-isoaspartate O-methyltransferase [Pseudorhodoplanes sp.]|nr:protein-L-isoaspartate O-methyltransferase [Pseudorhodoplanes sp.]
MADFAAARRMMVDGQIRTSDVTDRRLIAAMLEVPREVFVPRARRALAYLDLDIPVSEGAGGRPPRCLLKPMTLAKLIQAAEPAASDRVLDVGCATGYSAAVLAQLAGFVVALESDTGLAAEAKAALSDTGAVNVAVSTGALEAGMPAKAPYNLIILEGAVEFVPQGLLDQLAEGGRLACILGTGPAAKATLYTRNRGEISSRPIFDAAAPALPGFVKAPAFVF